MDYIIVLALLCYIIIIHFQLNKKNHQIDQMVEKLTKLEKDQNHVQLITLLEKHRVLRDEKIIRHNKLFDNSVLNFLFSNEKDSKIFVHYTKDELTARKISKEGFMFVNPFEKTAEQVLNDPIDLTYKHNIRKYYGKYVVVICISNDIFNYYDNELKPLIPIDNKANQALLDIPSFLNDNEDEVFTLSNHFIKGFFNYETGAIVINPEFKPDYSTLVGLDRFSSKSKR